MPTPFILQFLAGRTGARRYGCRRIKTAESKGSCGSCKVKSVPNLDYNISILENIQDKMLVLLLY